MPDTTISVRVSEEVQKQFEQFNIEQERLKVTLELDKEKVILELKQSFQSKLEEQ